MSDLKLGDWFRQRREHGICGLPTYSVTMDNGLVPREQLERKTDTNISPTDHSLVKEGDIAYNMMRMWQGACGRAPTDCIVSPAYIVVQPKAHADSRYFAYLFKSSRMKYLFWAYSYGLTNDRLRLYHKDFEKIPFEGVSSQEEQQKIAKVLSTWDEAIATAEKLLENSHKKKRALLKHLISSPHTESDWREIEFAKMATPVAARYNPAVDNGFDSCIELENLEADSGRLLSTTSTAGLRSLKVRFQRQDVLFGKLRPYLRKHYLPEEDGVCTTEIWALRPDTDLILPEYLYLLVQTDRFVAKTLVASGTHMPRADWKVVGRSRFKIPSKPLQSRIVETFGPVIRLNAAYAELVDQIKREKSALMQHLLAGKRRVPIERPYDH